MRNKQINNLNIHSEDIVGDSIGVNGSVGMGGGGRCGRRTIGCSSSDSSLSSDTTADVSVDDIITLND